ncbi:MAG: hypothetical protein O2782_06385 [bacterium]|nr:hypothetical protein [bacterium]
MSHFQLNRYSLPHLLAGPNTVHITAHRFGSPLTVRYEWSEGPDWEEPRLVEHTVEQDSTIALDVVGPACPRMRALTFSA